MAVGGDIIVSLDGRPIRSDGALEDTIIHELPGQSVTIGVIRGKRALTLHATLVARPQSLPTSG